MRVTFNENKCIYYFKLFYNFLQFVLTIIIDLLCFNNLDRLNNTNCNIINNIMVIINLRTLVSLIVSIVKYSINTHTYKHTNSDGYLFLLIAFQLCYSVQLVVLPSCVDQLWNVVPNSVYFIYTNFFCDIFLGLPILIFHLFLPLFEINSTEEEKRVLLY